MNTSYYYERNAFLPEHLMKISDYFQRPKENGGAKKQIKYIDNGLWRLRLSDAARALFTLIEIEGQYHPYFIEYLPTHKYNRSQFINDPKIVERCQKVGAELAKKQKEEEAQAAAELLESAEKNARQQGAKPQLSTFYGNEFTILDPFQQQVLKTQLPVVLSGVAGSGKSLMALKSIEQYIMTLSNQPRRNILYISKSETLVKQHQEYWKALPASQNPHHKVDFISLDFLIDEQIRNNGYQIIDTQNFDTQNAEKRITFAAFCKMYFKKQLKGNANKQAELIKSIREEFLICSGFDEASYLKLGDKQSTIPKENQEKRKRYYEVYKNYLYFLKSTKQIDPDFFPLELDQYALIAMDEAQDLSPFLINAIHAKAECNNILYCMDSHQRLRSSKSVRPYLLNKIGNDPKKHISLVCTHRCPPKVVAIANKVLAFKQELEGLGDKYETPNIQAVSSDKDLGSVYACEEQDLLALDWMKKPKQAYFVVITSKKNCEDLKILADLKKRFNTDNILSPEQAKGLEYEVVLAYDLYDEELFKLIKNKTQSLNQEFKVDTVNDQESSVTFCNEIYTSYTRAKTALIVCEKETHLNKILLNRIKEGVDAGLPPEDLFKKQSTEEEWKAEVINQLHAGNNNLARNHYRHLAKNKQQYDEEFELFVKELIKKENPPEKPKEMKPTPEYKLPEKVVIHTPKDLSNTSKKPMTQRDKKKSSPKPMELPESKPIVIHAPKALPNQSIKLVKQLQEHLFKVFEEIDFEETNFEKKKMQIKKIEKIFLMFLDSQDPTQIKPLDKIVRTQADGTTQTLLDFIDANPLYQELFLKCASHNLKFLMKLNFPYCFECSTYFTTKLEELSVIQDFLKIHSIDYKGNSPAHKLLNAFHQHSNSIQNKGAHLSHLANLMDMGLDTNQVEELNVDPLKMQDGLEDNNQLIHLAASLNDVLALLFLNARKVDLSKPKKDGNTIAHLAAIKGCSEVFKFLKKKEFQLAHLLSQPNLKGETPSHYLAKYGHIALFDELIELKIDLDACNELNFRPSHYAAMQGDQAVLEKLLDQGINLKQENSMRETPLMLAIAAGHSKIVRFLIDKCGFSNSSYYLSLPKSISIASKSDYAGTLAHQIEHLITTQKLRLPLTLNWETAPEVPINLAQLAFAHGYKDTAIYLKQLIIEKYRPETESKTEEAAWTHYFDITEPLIEPKDKHPSYHLMNMKRLLNAQTFNEAALIALWDNQQSLVKSLNQILVSSSAEKQESLMDALVANEEVANLFIKCLVNNTHLLNTIRFEIPSTTSSALKEKLKDLQCVQQLMEKLQLFAKKNLVTIKAPINLLVKDYLNNHYKEEEDFWRLFQLLSELGANLTLPDVLNRELIHNVAYTVDKFKLFEHLFNLVDLKPLDIYGYNIAHLAAQINNIAVLKKIKDNPECTELLFQPALNGSTPLHLLLSNKYVESFNTLLDDTFISECKTKFNMSNLNLSPDSLPHWAVKNEYLDILFKLKALGVDFEQRNSSEETPLSYAIRLGLKSMVEYLLDNHMANVHARIPITWGELLESHGRYFTDLVAFKALYKHKDWIDKTKIFIPLRQYALLYFNEDIYNYIMKQEASNDKAKLSCYAADASNLIYSAWIAAYIGDIDLLENLYNKNILLTAVDEDGFNIAHFAAHEENATVFHWIAGKEELRHLLTSSSLSGVTPAHICVEFEKPYTLDYLSIIYGNRPCCAVSGMNIAHLAALKGKKALFPSLKQNNLLSEPMTVSVANGMTPLMLAVMTGNIETVKGLKSENPLAKCNLNISKFLCLIENYTSEYQKIKAKIEARIKAIPSIKLLTEKDQSFDAYQIANLMGYIEIEDLLYQSKVLIEFNPNPQNNSSHGTSTAEIEHPPERKLPPHPKTLFNRERPPTPKTEPPSCPTNSTSSNGFPKTMN